MKALYQRGSAYGIPRRDVNGMDLLAVREALEEAIARALDFGDLHVLRSTGAPDVLLERLEDLRRSEEPAGADESPPVHVADPGVAAGLLQPFAGASKNLKPGNQSLHQYPRLQQH